jgi:hypothetical protein
MMTIAAAAATLTALLPGAHADAAGGIANLPAVKPVMQCSALTTLNLRVRFGT